LDIEGYKGDFGIDKTVLGKLELAIFEKSECQLVKRHILNMKKKSNLNTSLAHKRIQRTKKETHSLNIPIKSPKKAVN
jgi:hypothetical protein